ncbi:hypothetical protein MLD38_009163 [Melastoma candidum]|uniref:Uncharacterized protein n=1 Tax=Melastoma candidum TaxID=119954 RepID=A0ACB9RVT5_9MYRT|nr:hypothetical protein MLD38_009163 [Melastoma candidum]
MVFNKVVGRGINAALVLGVGSLAVTRLLTIDHEYWQGWTLYEILRYAPEHNWIAYEDALKTNPVLAKMAISGVVAMKENRFLSSIGNECSDQGSWDSPFMDLYPIIIISFARLFFPFKTGGLFLQKASNIVSELKATFWPMLTVCWWKLWPFAHLVTYGVIPVEQRLLWVDCVELIWVTILSTYSNEKSEARANAE